MEQVLEAGDWFISLYNDDGDPHRVFLVINRGDWEDECPQRCHDRSEECLMCQCKAGYFGIDCSQCKCLGTVIGDVCVCVFIVFIWCFGGVCFLFLFPSLSFSFCCL